MTRRCVYLGGSIGGLTYDEATGPRQRATELLNAIGWDTLDPCRGYEILSTLSVIEEGEQVQTLLGVTDAAITQRDRDDIRRADVMLVISGNHSSWGTAFELEFAYNLGKPIVVICDKNSPTRTHPWCRTMCSYFAETVDEAVEFIERWLDRDYKLESEKRFCRDYKENS